MKKVLLMSVVAVLGLGALVGCEEKKPATPVKKDAAKAPDAPKTETPKTP